MNSQRSRDVKADQKQSNLKKKVVAKKEPKSAGTKASDYWS